MTMPLLARENLRVYSMMSEPRCKHPVHAARVVRAAGACGKE